MFNEGLLYELHGQLTGLREVLAFKALVEPVNKLLDGFEVMDSRT